METIYVKHKTKKRLFLEKVLWFLGFLIILFASFTWLKATLNTRFVSEYLGLVLRTPDSGHERTLDINSLKTMYYSSPMDPKSLQKEQAITNLGNEKIDLLRNIRLHNILRRQTQFQSDALIVEHHGSMSSTHPITPSVQVPSYNQSNLPTKNSGEQNHINLPSNAKSNNQENLQAHLDQASDTKIIQNRIRQWEQAYY